MPSFDDGGPTLFLLVEHVLTALLDFFGLALDLVCLLVDAGRDVAAGMARLLQRVIDRIGRLIAQLDALVADLCAGPLAGLRGQQAGLACEAYFAIPMVAASTGAARPGAS